MYKYVWFCRWCGVVYRPVKQTYRDGFCTAAHKQAHWRAYNNYVTAGKPAHARPRACRVTRKKSK